jgi:hypothetical protein
MGDRLGPFLIINWNLAPLRSAIGSFEYWKFFKMALIILYIRDKILLLRFTIPVFHHSIIPGWKKENGGVAIPYYQAFLEIPIYKFMTALEYICFLW